MNTRAENVLAADGDAFGMAVAARLSEGADLLPHDFSERLRASRNRAVSKRRVESMQVATAVSVSGGEAVLQWGGHQEGFWNRLASLLPLLALVLGLITIVVLQDELRAREVAEVDAELLTDELPPSAYVDPGFAQYLRANKTN